jgi:hypothetical protein
VDQELFLRNEYLVAENRILKAQLKTPLRLTDAERVTLAEIAHRLGRRVIIPFLTDVKSRVHAAASMCFGGKPPLALLGRS